MAFGSNGFPLGPNGQYPRNRVSSYGNDIAPPSRVEEIYELSGEAQLPVTEKDFHSSINRVKGKMKQGSPNVHADPYGDIDKYRPKYAHRKSLRQYYQKYQSTDDQPEESVANDEWLKRRKQRFPGLESVGYEKIMESNRMKRIKNEVRPATGMSGVGFFGRNGNLGDMEQRYGEDRNQSLGYYTRRPYR